MINGWKKGGVLSGVSSNDGPLFFQNCTNMHVGECMSKVSSLVDYEHYLQCVNLHASKHPCDFACVVKSHVQCHERTDPSLRTPIHSFRCGPGACPAVAFRFQLHSAISMCHAEYIILHAGPLCPCADAISDPCPPNTPPTPR